MNHNTIAIYENISIKENIGLELFALAWNASHSGLRLISFMQNVLDLTSIIQGSCSRALIGQGGFKGTIECGGWQQTGQSDQGTSWLQKVLPPPLGE